MFSAKSQLKIIQPLTELKLLMFSKGNSSEEIGFSQPTQTEDRAMVPLFKKENGVLLEKIERRLLDDDVST